MNKRFDWPFANRHVVSAISLMLYAGAAPIRCSADLQPWNDDFSRQQRNADFSRQDRPNTGKASAAKPTPLVLCALLPDKPAVPTVDKPPQQPLEHKPAETPVPLVPLRGKVVCLSEEMHHLYQAPLSTGHEHLYGFRTHDGKYYTLLRTKFSEALFSDARFREKELLIRGRIFPESHIFDPAVIRSIRNGTIYDLYYYCDICDIQAVAPGPCECCQGPTELLEKPLANQQE